MLLQKEYITQNVYDHCKQAYEKVQQERPPTEEIPGASGWIYEARGIFNRVTGPLDQKVPHTIVVKRDGSISYSWDGFLSTVPCSLEALRALEIPPTVLDQIAQQQAKNKWDASVPGVLWNALTSLFQPAQS
jgi:hypothetical protein